MNTKPLIRATKTVEPVRAVVPDFELEEMDGFYELGMDRRSLAVARRIFQREKLTAEAFTRSVMRILSGVTRIESWIPPVETAWKRLSTRAQRRARPQMLGFRYSANELDQALPLATVRPRNGSDLMFSLATFTHHQKEREAQRLVELGMQYFSTVKDSFERSTVCRAMMHRHLARKEWSKALRMGSHMPAELAFIEDQHLDMALAFRGLVEASLGRLEKLADSDLEVSHPGLDDELIARSRRSLNRLRNSLAWVKATEES